MFCFPSFFARLPDEISTTDVLKDRANIRFSASRPSSQGGGGALQNCDEKCLTPIHCDSSQISKRKFPECTLTSAAFTPVCWRQCSQWNADPGLNCSQSHPAALSRFNVAANIQQGHERKETPDGFFPTRVLDLGQAWNSTPTPTLRALLSLVILRLFRLWD